MVVEGDPDDTDNGAHTTCLSAAVPLSDTLIEDDKLTVKSPSDDGVDELELVAPPVTHTCQSMIHTI